MNNKKKKKIISENYLNQIPEKSKERPWKTDKSGMAVIDVENKGFYHFIAQRFFKKPRVSHISLDCYGTAVWNSIDGGNTVYDIVMIMEHKFPDEKARMLDRVVTYMAILQNNRFITIARSSKDE